MARPLFSEPLAIRESALSRVLIRSVTAVGDKGVPEEELLHHDEKTPNPSLAYLLSQLGPPEFPTPVGVFPGTSSRRPTRERSIVRSVRPAKRQPSRTWTLCCEKATPGKSTSRSRRRCVTGPV